MGQRLCGLPGGLRAVSRNRMGDTAEDHLAGLRSDSWGHIRRAYSELSGLDVAKGSHSHFLPSPLLSSQTCSHCPLFGIGGDLPIPLVDAYECLDLTRCSGAFLHSQLGGSCQDWDLWGSSSKGAH